jgi:beta-barrel assembly-enhancing protease
MMPNGKGFVIGVSRRSAGRCPGTNAQHPCGSELDRRTPIWRFGEMISLLVVVAGVLAIPVLAERTKLKPDFNIFSIAQDVEIGQRISKELEAQKEILRIPRATSYLDALGQRLAMKAPGHEQYRFQFRIIDDASINAFGLPGGIVYVNRGTIEAVANEAQLAGVIAHEIAHVVLRHGTHQISHVYALQTPLSNMGAVGSKSITEVLSKIGGGFAGSSIVLRNPREAESQADLLGTQILYDAGYDPRAAVQFFEKIETPPLIGDHPNPANRTATVKREIERLGPVSSSAVIDSPEFQTNPLRN